MKNPVFLITAGPTREYIDPVRYISNASSGLMGYLLAAEAVKYGKVILVSGPTAGLKIPRGVKIINVVSAGQMFTALKNNLMRSDIIIGAAAVSDFRPEGKYKLKMKRKVLSLKLIENQDIIAYAARNKGSRVVAGFALETNNLLANALGKLKEKKLDLIVANGPKSISSRTSNAWILRRNASISPLGNIKKKILARKLVNETLSIWKNNQSR